MIAAVRSDDVSVRRGGFETLVAIYWKPIYNLLEPTMVGYDETTKDLFKVDVEGAKALLEQSGWTGDAASVHARASKRVDDPGGAFTEPAVQFAHDDAVKPGQSLHYARLRSHHAYTREPAEHP